MNNLLSPFCPFSPGGPFPPGGPSDPLYPESPGGPTHTQVHAKARKYCDNLRIYLQTKSLLVFCINEGTLLEDWNKYEYDQGKGRKESKANNSGLVGHKSISPPAS